MNYFYKISSLLKRKKIKFSINRRSTYKYLVISKINNNNIKYNAVIYFEKDIIDGSFYESISYVFYKYGSNIKNFKEIIWEGNLYDNKDIKFFFRQIDKKI